MAKPKHMPALDHELQESPFGRLFIDPHTAAVTDMSGFRVVHQGVDTVRQLYSGSLRDGVLALFDEPTIVHFAGERWATGRVGRDSGYQYRLQNADLGLILLIKSFHAQADAAGPHLKIEVSPHCIQAHTPDELQRLMDELADAVLSERETKQCAVHLALDVQGWTPPRDFEARLHCRARRVRRYDGVDSVEFASASAVYGRGETWMFGSPGGIQLAVYNKTLEARARDKLDYWHDRWSDSTYNAYEDVYRIEFRFHHSVIEQFSQGSACETSGEVAGFVGFNEVSLHLDGLWSYACESFRYLARPGWFDPAWTLISQQAWLPGDAPIRYKRHYKTAAGFSGKNVELLLGNFISLAARHRMSASQAWKALESLPFYDVIADHYLARGKRTWELKRHVRNLLEERVVRWGRAV